MKSFVVRIFASLIALAFLGNPDVARAQNSRNCAWPIEVSPEGYGNVLLPDNSARYWLMPFENEPREMVIKGTYPNARYFSYVAYNGRQPTEIAGSLYDAQITSDPGSANPFQITTTHQLSTYTVKFQRGGQTSGNTIAVSATNDSWVLLRIYVPNADPNLSGQNLTGGVPLPTIMVDGQQLKPCLPVNNLTDLTAVLHLIFDSDKFDKEVMASEGTPSSDRLWFAPPQQPTVKLFPNPHNKYASMLPGNYQPGRIIVVHGKAPGFPGTFDGSPIWVPSRGFQRVDMRYWSVCNNDAVLPVPAVQCAADLTTDLEGGYYTIVISDDMLRPDWLRPNVNWLPWGDELYPKVVTFRNMLPATDFPYSIQNAAVTPGCTFSFELPNIPDQTLIDETGPCVQRVMGDYYPVAAWCDNSTFVHGGWCTAARF